MAMMAMTTSSSIRVNPRVEATARNLFRTFIGLKFIGSLGILRIIAGPRRTASVRFDAHPKRKWAFRGGARYGIAELDGAG